MTRLLVIAGVMIGLWALGCLPRPVLPAAWPAEPRLLERLLDGRAGRPPQP